MSKRKGKKKRADLLIAQRVDGVELGGTRSRIEAGGETHKYSKRESGQHEPPRHGRKLDGIKILAVEIGVGAERECPTEEPAE